MFDTDSALLKSFHISETKPLQFGLDTFNVFNHTQSVGPATVKEAFHKKVGHRRWGVGLVTLGISLLGLWLMIDIVGARGWTPLEVIEVGVFGVLFAHLAFGFTQAFLGFLVLAEGHEPLKITNTLDETTPLASTAVVMPAPKSISKRGWGRSFAPR